MKKFTLLLSIFISQIALNAQVITIQFESTPTTPPSVSKAFLKYNKDFAYSYTLDDATDDAFTTAYPITAGGYIARVGETFPPLFYTDGCGNDVTFKLGLAWNSANAAGIDVHDGSVASQLTWKQLDTLYAYGWDIFNHSWSHRSRWVGSMLDSDYVNEIEKNRTAVRQKTRQQIEMPIFVAPSGDDFYHEPAFRLGHSAVFNQNGNVTGFLGISAEDDNFNFRQQAIFRRTLQETLEVAYYVDSVARRSANGGTKLWYNEFSHRIDNLNAAAPENFYKFRDYMRRLANLYGKLGNDKMWMAPIQEVQEYIATRRAATFTTAARGAAFDLLFDLSNVPRNMRRRSISLIVNSNVNFTNVTVPEGVRVTFRGTGANKLINLDFTNYQGPTNTTDLAEQKLRLMPNPTKNQLTVELPTDSDLPVQLEVFDTAGRLIWSEKKVGKLHSINTEILRGGFYVLVAKRGQAIFRETFVKQN